VGRKAFSNANSTEKLKASHMEDSEAVTASADECICENSFLGESGLVESLWRQGLKLMG
jgi:hypothetical protein